ncbi:MAG: SPFH domain-containing protein [Candidatus Taylorbacteria bacterium]
MKDHAPPMLKKPVKSRPITASPGDIANPNKALSVSMINDFDFESLLINVLTVIIIFILSSVLLGFISKIQIVTLGVPIIVTSGFIIMKFGSMWTTVKAREASVYLDYIRPRKILVYLQGFHFTSWCSEVQESTINFQKHEIITTRFGGENQVTFTTRDGYVMFANILILYNRRNDLDALSKSLRYQNTEIRAWILALVAARLSDLAGQNSCETLLYYKSAIVQWVSKLFDGQENISEFEDQIGCEIKDPTLEDFDLIPESRKIYAAKSKMQTITDGIAALRAANPDMSVNEASRIAQAAVEVITRHIETYEYEGIPQDGLSALGLGSGGLGVIAPK